VSSNPIAIVHAGHPTAPRMKKPRPIERGSLIGQRLDKRPFREVVLLNRQHVDNQRLGPGVGKRVRTIYQLV